MVNDEFSRVVGVVGENVEPMTWMNNDLGIFIY